jgi:hypothetical protein
MTVPSPDPDLDRIKDAIFSGQKIRAIKLHRQITGSSLTEAKDAVDRLEQELRTESPERFSSVPRAKGCFGTGVVAFLLLTACIAWLLSACVSDNRHPRSNAAPAAATPEDWRYRITSHSFTRTAQGEWTSPLVRPSFSFDELIYSWRLNHPGDTFRLYLRAFFTPEDQTGWLYAGAWGSISNRVANRKVPSFERGVLDMDWLKLKQPAQAFQFKVVEAGPALAAPPELTIVATSNHSKRTLPRKLSSSSAPDLVLDVPLRRQVDSQGTRMPDRCQSAALASAMEYYGKSIPLEQIVRLIHDPEYDYPGIWPRVIGAASEFGFSGYIDRFRDWERVRQALKENKILLCSIRLQEGQCKAPPCYENRQASFFIGVFLTR